MSRREKVSYRKPKKIVGPRYNSNLDWFRYYEKRFNKFEHPDTAHLAMFYYGCALRDGELDVP